MDEKTIIQWLRLKNFAGTKKHFIKEINKN